MSEGLSRDDKRLLKTVLAKKQMGRPLTKREEEFSQVLFDRLISSKETLYKTIKVLTGEEMRKMATEPVRDPKPYTTRQVDTIDGENADPKIEELKSKLPDVDNAKDTNSSEEKRLGDKIQRAIPPSSADVGKFVSLNPVKVGDWVVKNFRREGQLVMTGQVYSLSQADNVAMVKWADGRITGEHANLLVKMKKDEAEDKTDADKKNEAEEASPPIVKGYKTKRGSKKPKPPKIRKGVRKNGDIFSGQVYAPVPSPSSGSGTPFEDLVCTLSELCNLANQIKGRRNKTKDEEISNAYDEILDHIKMIVDELLGGLSVELEESEYVEEE